MGNGYGLPLRILDDGGVPLSSTDFPVDIGFTLNGTSYTQQIDYDQQVVNIDASWLTIDTEQESQIVVQLTAAKEKQGTNIPLLAGYDVHTRTIHPILKLEFIYTDSLVNEQNYRNNFV